MPGKTSISKMNSSPPHPFFKHISLIASYLPHTYQYIQLECGGMCVDQCVEFEKKLMTTCALNACRPRNYTLALALTLILTLAMALNLTLTRTRSWR